MSGHIFINYDWYGFDDAVYTAVILAKIISDTGQPTANVIEQFPKTFATPELNLDVDDVKKFKMVEKFKEQMQFPDAEFNTIDGGKSLDWKFMGSNACLKYQSKTSIQI